MSSRMEVKIISSIDVRSMILLTWVVTSDGLTTVKHFMFINIEVKKQMYL